MAARFPKPKRGKRFLPRIVMDINKQTSYQLTYKSSLEWMSRNHPTFQKALDLVTLYPTLSDHKYMDPFWSFVSMHFPQKLDNGIEHSSKIKSRNKCVWGENKLTDSNYSMHTPHPSKDMSNEFIVSNAPALSSYEEPKQICVIGISHQMQRQISWSNFILRLTSKAFVHCAPKGNLLTSSKRSDAIVYIVTEYTWSDKESLDVLEWASSHDVPVVFVREPGFQIPNCIWHCSKGVPNHWRPVVSRNRSLSSFSLSSLPQLGKSGYYHAGDDVPSAQNDPSCGARLLVQGSKDAILYSGNNDEFCVLSVLHLISEALDKQNTPSERKDDQFTYASKPDDKLNSSGDEPPGFNDSIPDEAATSCPHASADTSSNDVTVKSQNGVSEVKLFTEVDRRMSIDSETIYVLFPVNDKGERAGSPKYIRWPRRKSQDTVDDFEVSSDLSVGFQDIDLGRPIIFDDVPSDEEFNLNFNVKDK